MGGARRREGRHHVGADDLSSWQCLLPGRLPDPVVDRHDHLDDGAGDELHGSDRPRHERDARVRIGHSGTRPTDLRHEALVRRVQPLPADRRHAGARVPAIGPPGLGEPRGTPRQEGDQHRHLFAGEPRRPRLAVAAVSRDPSRLPRQHPLRRAHHPGADRSGLDDIAGPRVAAGVWAQPAHDAQRADPLVGGPGRSQRPEAGAVGPRHRQLPVVWIQRVRLRRRRRHQVRAARQCRRLERGGPKRGPLRPDVPRGRPQGPHDGSRAVRPLPHGRVLPVRPRHRGDLAGPRRAVDQGRAGGVSGDPPQLVFLVGPRERAGGLGRLPQPVALHGRRAGGHRGAGPDHPRLGVDVLVRHEPHD